MGKTLNKSGWRRLYPFDSHFLDIEGMKYHYLDEGSGEPVIMVHGNPTWSFYYRELVKALSPDYRTIAPDHIGCGLSDKPGINEYDYRMKSRVQDLEALVGHLDLQKKITLVLHDWGGMIGMALAVKYPEKIGRIIILNTAAFFPPSGKRLPFRIWFARNVKPVSIPAILGFNLFSLCALYMASFKGLHKDVKIGLSAPYNTWKNRIATLKFVQDIPVKPADPSFMSVKHVDENLQLLKHVPMLICWGKHDFVFDMDYLAEWRRRFPDAKVHLFENAGHYLLEDEPSPIIDFVKNFLKTHALSK